MTATQLAPVLSRKSLENTYRYGGGVVSIRVTGAQTGGAFSLWEAVQKPGGEPPLHVHHTSDETFFILEGKMRFQVGDQVIDAGAGDVVFAPRGIPHTFRVKSDVVKAMTLCTPSGFEDWFRHLGEPATTFELPDQVAPFAEADLPKMLALGRQLQVEVLQVKVDI